MFKRKKILSRVGRKRMKVPLRVHCRLPVELQVAPPVLIVCCRRLRYRREPLCCRRRRCRCSPPEARRSDEWQNVSFSLSPHSNGPRVIWHDREEARLLTKQLEEQLFLLQILLLSGLALFFSIYFYFNMGHGLLQKKKKKISN